MASYSETLNHIFNLRGGKVDLGLHRMEQALTLFDHPERCYPAIHIAGTNGKGSTAAMLHSVFLAQGYRVALYTSPHLVSFTERIRVGKEEISQEEVVELGELIKERLEQANVELTFFEFITVMALVYFARRKIDLAVVEVGLGGRLDATNLVLPRVSIITTISKDHEAYLGSDLLSIAREKAGIIKRGAPVVCGLLPAEVKGLVEELAAAKGSASYFLERDFFFSLKHGDLFDYRGLNWKLKNVSTALQGRYQRSNAAVALAALEVLSGDFPVTEAAAREGLKGVFWPGRFERAMRAPSVILDGAHNIEGIKAVVEEVKAIGEMQGGRKAKVLFAAMADKDWRAMLRELSAVATEVILTRVSMERSADPIKLAEAVPEGMPARVIESPAEAVRWLLSGVGADQTILITGSLYLLGEIKPLLAEALKESQQGKSAGIGI